MKSICASVALAVIACGQSSRISLTPGRTHDPAIIHERHGKNVTSGNWSGYAVTGTKGSVSDVKASWVVPAIQGTCPASDQFSSFWVGIDGYSSNTVEQIGTDSDCQGGQPVYYAWFEFYPHPSFTINNFSIQPGNVISAEVSSSGKSGTFTVTLKNVTTGQSFSTSTKIPSAAQSSAEWIAEAPYSGGILPLADFGTVQFGQNYTAVAGTNFATVGGSTHALGSFGSNVSITMDTKDGTIKAQPSGLTNDNTSFTISWLSAGP